MIDGRDIAKRHGFDTHREWIAWVHTKNTNEGILDLPIKWGVQGDPVKAFIDFGRWSAACPDCGATEYVTPGEDIFYHFGCGNIGNKHYVRPVEFPAEREAIEKAIMDRPVKYRGGSNYVQREMEARPYFIDGKPYPRSWTPDISLRELQNDTNKLLTWLEHNGDL